MIIFACFSFTFLTSKRFFSPFPLLEVGKSHSSSSTSIVVAILKFCNTDQVNAQTHHTDMSIDRAYGRSQRARRHLPTSGYTNVGMQFTSLSLRKFNNLMRKRSMKGQIDILLDRIFYVRYNSCNIYAQKIRLAAKVAL